MASDRSLYRKVQVVLDIAKSVKVSDLNELKKAIERQELTIFYSKRYDEDADDMIPSFSEKIVSSTIRMCLLLELVDGNGKLTPSGRQALRKRKYESVVSDEVRRILDEAGVDLSEMNDLVLANLSESPPLLPTSRVLWEQIDCELGYGTFSRLLTLLSHCGGAESSQRKVYLKFDLGA